MNSNGIAVVNAFAVNPGGGPGEFEFAGDDFLGEIAFADEVGNDIDFLGVDQVESFAHGRFFLPEAAVDFTKNLPISDFAGVVEVGRRGVRVLGGAVSDDEQSRIWLWRKVHARA